MFWVCRNLKFQRVLNLDSTVVVVHMMNVFLNIQLFATAEISVTLLAFEPRNGFEGGAL